MNALDDLKSIIVEFRKICRSKYLGDLDLSYRPKGEEDIYNDFSGSDSFYYFFGAKDGVAGYIARLLNTPRKLKYSLRSTYHIWESLHGEIFFDDVLVLQSIRTAAPEAFNLIISKIDEIRALANEPVLEDQKKRQERIISDFDKVSSDLTCDQSALKSLLEFLFPKLAVMTGDSEKPPQSVSSLGATDYWRRYLRGGIVEGEIRDQEVLSIYRSVKFSVEENKKVQDSIIRLFSNNIEICEKFESLLSWSSDRYMAMYFFTYLVEGALKMDGVTSSRDSIAGFSCLWRLYIHPKVDNVNEFNHIVWVNALIRKVLPRSMRLSNDIFYYFRSNCMHERGAQASIIRAAMIDFAKTLFRDQGKSMLLAIDPGYIHSCYHFSVLFSGNDYGGSGFVFDEWEWFFDDLLDAGERSASLIAPQISVFLVNEKRDFGNFSYSFDEDLLCSYFPGDKRARVLRVLEQSAIDLGHDFLDDPRSIKRLACAQQYAQQTL